MVRYYKATITQVENGYSVDYDVGSLATGLKLKVFTSFKELMEWLTDYFDEEE